MEYKVILNDEEKLKMDQASKHYKEDRLDMALPILDGLHKAHPSSPMLTATLANLYWDLNNYAKATELFYQAVDLGPYSEKISRGLFHILWEQHNEDAAVKEIQRFINEGEPSKEYIEMALEINSKRNYNIKVNSLKEQK